MSCAQFSALVAACNETEKFVAKFWSQVICAVVVVVDVVVVAAAVVSFA